MVGKNLLCGQEVIEEIETELHLELEAGGGRGEVVWEVKITVAGCFGLPLGLGLWLAWNFWILDGSQC